MEKTKTIVIRDRRARHQFSIHNRLMDEWLPLIGPQGYLLYSLYVRLASRDDERAFPGYRLIRAHLGLSQATISDYNKLLSWCGLIHIKAGHSRRSNSYYLLDIPEVRPERLAEIGREARASLRPNSRFLASLLKRLEAWQPFQAHWGKPNSEPVTVYPDQPDSVCASEADACASEAEASASPADACAPAAEAEQSKVTIQRNNPKEEGDRTQASRASFAVVRKRETPPKIGIRTGVQQRFPAEAATPDPASMEASGVETGPAEAATPGIDSVEDSAGGKRKQAEARAMFAALARVCDFDLGLLSQKRRGQLNKIGKILRDRQVSPAQVAGFDDWWRQHDWRGRQGDAPAPQLILDRWGSYQRQQRLDQGGSYEANQRNSAGQHRFAARSEFGLPPTPEKNG